MRPERFRWEYERDYHPEPTLKWHINAEVTTQLATVYTKDSRVLRGWYEWGRKPKGR